MNVFTQFIHAHLFILSISHYLFLRWPFVFFSVRQCKHSALPGRLKHTSHPVQYSKDFHQHLFVKIKFRTVMPRFQRSAEQQIGCLLYTSTAGGAEFYGVYEQVVPDIVEQFFVTGIRDFI